MSEEIIKDNYNYYKNSFKNNYEIDRLLEIYECSIMITDFNYPNKILYVSSYFENQLGYNNNQIIGKTCSILQGKETCLFEKKKIRSKINNGESFITKIINYDINNNKIINFLFLKPIKNDNLEIINYLGIINTRPYYLKNNFTLDKLILKNQNIINFLKSSNNNNLKNSNYLIDFGITNTICLKEYFEDFNFNLNQIYNNHLSQNYNIYNFNL